MVVIPTAAQRLRDSCERIRCDAQSLAEAPPDRQRDRIHRQCADLMTTVAGHVELATAQLTAIQQRRLQHDHHRMTQLARAILLAADDADRAALQAAARRLQTFIVDHVRRECGD